MTIRLHVTPAEGEPYDHQIEGDGLVIGRSTRCDLSIADRFLSRQHARLYREEKSWLVDDLGSRNGTYVNGERISRPTSVRPGDVIAMSASLVKVLRENWPEASTGAHEITTSSDVYYRPASDVLLQTKTPPPADRSQTQEALRVYADRLAMLNEVHQGLARSISLEELLELILDRTFEHLRPEHGAIFLRSPKGTYHRAASRSAHGAPGGLVYSESLISEVADKGMAALVLDAQTDRRFSGAQSLLDAGVRSLVAAPLLDQVSGSLGLMVLSSNAAVRQFSKEDLELLVTLASVAAMRIRNVALAEEAAERRRLEHELELARRIQVGLFPEELPQFPGYRIYGSSEPSRGVSGDYFEIIDRNDGAECVLMVADVAGKGMAASLLTSSLEAFTSSLIEAGLEPDEVFNRICRPFARRTPANRFATVFLAVLDVASGRVRFANAGHVPPILVRASGEVEWLGATGTPLGLLADCEYGARETELESGDTLILYSDGYTEAEDGTEEEFGHQRLAELCVANRNGSPDEMAQAIDREVDRFAAGAPATDDRTVVIVRRD